MLELGVPKFYVGSSKCAKHTQHAKHANSRGVWGMPENFEIRYQEIEFGGIFGGFSCQ